MKKYLNYGLVKKNSKEYRNALRAIRKNYKKYGAKFDNTEVYALDSTLFKFIYKRGYSKHPYLKWFINGTPIQYWNILPWDYSLEYINKEEELRKTILLEVLVHHKQKIVQFLLPRMKAYYDSNIGYPVKFDTFVNWQKYIKETIEELEKGEIEKFINEMQNFWW